ncbi:MAG TPA: DUF6677 family protein [Blastocatellia bacterium]|nr:DUF6677 family protein [Blastocatellia bacterium]
MQSEGSSEKPLPAVASQIAPVSPARTAAATVASLVLPGLGHILLGRVVRGVVIFTSIAVMFVLGFWMKGHLYKPEMGEWLTYLFTFCNLGIGLPYFICYLLNFGFELAQNQAAVFTYEYGNTFLLVAGLLNYLAMLDAFDIAVGRKG